MPILSRPILSRRTKLADLHDHPGDHPGLALQRLLPQRNDKSEATGKLYNALASITVDAQGRNSLSEVYKLAFDQWKGSIEKRGGQTFRGTAIASLAIGLGNASATEVGLTLHHTFGVPMLPGTALKGLCRRAFQTAKINTPSLTDEVEKVLFGYSDKTDQSAGYITFWDAWYIPGTGQGKPFHRDVITVHHPDYYQKKDTFPTDFDDPTPVPFLVVPPKTEFLFALTAPNEQWAAVATTLLQAALTQLGIGGKTNAGYGYFTFPDVPTTKQLNLLPVANQPSAPATVPQEETWTDCELERKEEAGDRWAVRVRFGEKRMTITQGDWGRLPGKPVPLAKGKKRIATVHVQFVGNEYKVLRVEL